MKILLSSLYPYAFFILLLIIPFDEYVRALPNILLGILVITFPMVISKKDFLKLKSPGSYLFFGLFVFLVLSTSVLDRWDDNFYIIKKVAIAVVLVIFYLPVQDFKNINRAVIFSSLLAIIYSLYNIVLLINETGTFNFGDTQNPLETLLVDRLYLGLLCIMSILVSYKEITKNFNPENKYYVANILINIIFLFVIVSKIALITLLCLVILRFFYKGINKKIIIGTLVFLIGIILFAFWANDNIEKRFLYVTPNSSKSSFIENVKRREPRTKIWECSYIIFKEETNLWTGSGFKTTNDKLLDCYDVNIENEGRREWFLHEKYNTHNQFIDFILSTGILGLMLFFALFLALFFKFRKEYFPTALLITIVLFSFVESFFHRQIGGYYFGIILIFLLLEKNRSGKLEAHKNEPPNK